MEPVHEHHPVWSSPFPLHRNPEMDNAFEFPLFYGDYYTAVRAFLKKNRCRFLIEAIRQQTHTSVRQQDIQSIRIHLEKHGEFYHPARIAVRVNGQEHLFGLNVAVSQAGKKTIHHEYALLKRLRKGFPWRYIPDVYALDTVSVRDGRMEMIMFLAEWFQGYHEFHLSGCGAGENTDVLLWNGAGVSGKVAQPMILPLFRKAAEILTCYYNISSFEQICFWHHAAGDFIIAVCGDRLDMRLISVREYASLTDTAHPDPETMLHAMLVFLLDLSLRMRLDRSDGIGELVWADDRAVVGAANGFVDGISRKFRIDPLAEPLWVLFTHYIGSCTPDDLFDVGVALVDAYPASAETDLIRRHLEVHCLTLGDALKFCIHKYTLKIPGEAGSGSEIPPTKRLFP